MIKKLLHLCSVLLISSLVYAQDSAVLTQREQAEVIDNWLEYRIENLLPELMTETEVDMWVVISREYNEDPVIRTMLPATWHAARRRTILVMYQPAANAPVETYAVARYDVGKSFKRAWDPESQPDQWQALMDLISSKNPKKIGLNYSKDYGHADGLTTHEHQVFLKYLPENLQSKVVSAQTLAVRWLETRTQPEMATYKHIQEIAHAIVAEGLSEAVITPGVTTTDDVVWWYRERIKELKLDTWFHPSVDIQRADPENKEQNRDFASKAPDSVIMPGDLLHVDFGISYLRLNTDTQEMAYVLKAGETQVPDYLQKAFKQGNRVQDILTSNFVTGRTGNEILRASRKAMDEEGIRGSIYTHPLGFYGHSAGPTIGMWDNQGDTPGAGDFSLHAYTGYAIELNAVVFVPEWNKDVRIMLEEGALFDGQKVTYYNGRQQEIIPIPRVSSYLGY
ncbi:aminopeptidase P family protein [Algoriphagus halophytocola]|uniref:Aminopeptidase P family protein n=1 Tax=Algoriphagus halophytocola TaxID=2991499 RepID=A0ABY6MKS5_9BACT|nr:MULTISPECIES: aminopeptidase P family protein [unclassified Algoriphagus]UZD23710.1 aminopeptidase P family protein [Algoriphagus sp. TR-M5]WBL45004.1 aminopeptidase P family protein [Algoriphagus sp. TR-M9]